MQWLFIAILKQNACNTASFREYKNLRESV